MWEEDGQRTAELVRECGGEARYWRVDVADESRARHVFDVVTEAFGGLDVLLNSAGIAGENKPTEDVCIEDRQRVIANNVLGVFLSTK